MKGTAGPGGPKQAKEPAKHGKLERFQALILRFFKSFTTNPRLDVVIQTIVDCTPNVVLWLRSVTRVVHW